MKTNKIPFVILMLVGIALHAQKKPEIEGNKEVITRKGDITGSFNTLEVDDELDLQINPGVKNGFEIETDSNLVNIVQFKVVDSVLKVYTTHGIKSKKKLNIALGIAKLENLILRNDAKVTSDNVITARRFRLTGNASSRFDLKVESDWVSIDLQENAGGKVDIDSENTSITMSDRTDMKARVRTERVKVIMGNSAELNIDGQADEASFRLEKSSELDGRDMKVRTATLTSANRSDVYVYATSKIEVNAEGGSKVYVYGNPDVNILGLTDSSKIIKK